MRRALELDPPSAAYYPPRRPWYGGLRRLWFGIRREMHLEAVEQRAGLSFGKSVLGLLVPGFAWWAHGRRITGVSVGVAWVTGIATFLILLGYPAATVAIGLVIALHTTSILHLLGRFSPGSNVWHQVLSGLAVTFIVSQLIYLPLRRLMERRWAVPVRTANRVIVVNPASSPSAIRRGDRVAYRLSGSGGRGYRLTSGISLEHVLAVAGDRVVFGSDTIQVNGVDQPRRAHMPTQGEVVVLAGHWFIWPDMSVSGYLVTEELIRRAMLGGALVPETDLIGMPYKRWCFRRQTSS